jgi:hypothetical protein
MSRATGMSPDIVSLIRSTYNLTLVCSALRCAYRRITFAPEMFPLGTVAAQRSCHITRRYVFFGNHKDFGLTFQALSNRARRCQFEPHTTNQLANSGDDHHTHRHVDGVCRRLN